MLKSILQAVISDQRALKRRPTVRPGMPDQRHDARRPDTHAKRCGLARSRTSDFKAGGVDMNK